MAVVVGVQTWLKFVDKAAARDKFSKLLQYLAKFFGWVLQDGNTDLAKRLSTFSTITGDARRLSRFCSELSLIPTLSNFDSRKLKDPFEILSLCGSVLNANYLFWDHFRWLRHNKVIEGDLATFKQRSVVAWFWGITCNLIVATYKLYSVSNKIARFPKKELSQDQQAELKTLQANKKTLIISYAKHIPDLICAGTFANYFTRFNSDGIIGFLGIIAALQGVYELWPQSA